MPTVKQALAPPLGVALVDSLRSMVSLGYFPSKNRHTSLPICWLLTRGFGRCEPLAVRQSLLGPDAGLSDPKFWREFLDTREGSQP